MKTMLRSPSGRLLALLLAIWFAASANAAGRLIRATPADYRQQLAALGPGDTLRLAPGEYRDGLRIHHMVATSDRPIVIRGTEGSERPVFVARAGANTISIVDSAHIHIRDLVLDGRGIAVDAVKAEGHASWAHHITIENLTIVNHGANQQIAGISTKCPAWGWVIRGNRIHGAGTGLYLGNSGGIGPFFAGVIEHNLVTDPLGYAMQIKHQHARPALPGAPRGPQVTTIRHNVFSKANGASAGPLARPNLLLGHWPLAGDGSQDEYRVYGNFLHDNPTEALFQGEGNIAFYNNILLNRQGPGIHIQPHNDVPRNVFIFQNTVITSGNPIVIRMHEGPSAHVQVVSGNAVFSPHAIQGGMQGHNLSFAFEQASGMLGSAASGNAFDAFPRDQQMRCPLPDPGLTAGRAEAHCDFNGRRRTPNYCGAYAGEGVNPGWPPALDIKPRGVCGVQ